MARLFNGTTDRIDFANPFQTDGQPVSVSAWLYCIDRTVQGYLTHIGQTGDGADSYHTGLRISGTDANEIEWFRRATAGSNRSATTTGDVVVNSEWANFILTDPNSTWADATDINIYKNGVETSYSDQTGGANSEVTDSGGSLSHGGRIYDDGRNLDGYLAEVAWWNRVLTTDEVAALGKGYSPLLFPYLLKSYTRLIRSNIDEITGSVGTLDGTSVTTHPPIIYPAPPIFHMASGTTDLSIDIGLDEAAYQGTGVRILA